MKSWLLVVPALLVLLTLLPSSAAADEDCPKLSASLEGRTFIAKKPLYDTKIAQEGIIKLERDKEEIPEGASFTVLNVDCGGKKVELTLRQNTTYKRDKVEIYFLFNRAQRAMPDADATFEKMMSYVFEYPEDAYKEN